MLGRLLTVAIETPNFDGRHRDERNAAGLPGAAAVVGPSF
jgi:hypothetical protein